MAHRDYQVERKRWQPRTRANITCLITQSAATTPRSECQRRMAMARSERRYGEAEQSSLTAIKHAEISKEDYERLAGSLNTLGLIYGDQNKYDGAQKTLQWALQIREQHLGPEHPAVAVSLANLGEIYETQGEFSKAEPFFKRSVEIKQKTFSPDNTSLALGFSKLGRVYSEEAKCHEAMDMSSRAVAITERVFGRDVSQLAPDLNAMGRCNLFLGDYAAAENMFRRELEINKNISEGKNAYVAADLGSLALVYSMEGKKPEAESAAQQSAEALLEPLAVANP